MVRISSGVAAAGQIAGAAAMVLPGGAMGKGLANMGIIGSELDMLWVWVLLERLILKMQLLLYLVLMLIWIN